METFEAGHTTASQKPDGGTTNEDVDDVAKDPASGPAVTTEMLAEIESQLDQIDTRLKEVEERSNESDHWSSPFTDPTLVHKVIHACMESNRITEDEEVRILEMILHGSATSPASEQ